MRWNAIYLSIPAHPSLSRCDKKFLRKPRRKYADGKCVIRDLTYCSAGWANLSEIFLLAGVGEAGVPRSPRWRPGISNNLIVIVIT